MERLSAALDGILWEVIFVDDASKDGTAEVIEDLRRGDKRIHLISRRGRKGLSSACVEGMRQCRGGYIAVMDADLQHEETLLKPMLAGMKSESLDMAIGSRYIGKTILGSWSKPRLIMSQCATVFVRRFLPMDVKDPLSGFFMVTRGHFARTVDTLSGKGQKILLDICLSSPSSVRFKELPYQMEKRHSGYSKLSLKVIWENLLILCKNRE